VGPRASLVSVAKRKNSLLCRDITVVVVVVVVVVVLVP
jgi:hypothetical protein